MSTDGSDKTAALLSIIEEYLSSRPKRILVVGCGTGQEAGFLARHLSADTIGIDLGAELDFDMKGSLPAKLIRMDAQQLEFPDDHFDLVYSFHALEHIADPERALAEMARVLVLGGIFCVGTPNKQRLIGYLGSKTSALNKIKWNFSDFWMRAKGEWDNKKGAHAGFFAIELVDLCRKHFGSGDDVSDDYYMSLYPSHRRSVSVLRDFGSFRYFIYPCVYVVGRRIVTGRAFCR